MRSGVQCDSQKQLLELQTYRLPSPHHGNPNRPIRLAHRPPHGFCYCYFQRLRRFVVCDPMSYGPCELRDIANGTYLDGYRSGLTISHGSSVRYSCEPNFAKGVPDPVQCLEGKLRSDVPKCMPVASKTKEINSISLDMTMSRTGFSSSETAASAPITNLCTLPERLHNTLLYRGSTFIEPKNADILMATAAIRREKLPSGGSNRYFPNGTEVLFKCLSAYSGKKTTWKIVCQDGVWVGRPHNCEPRIHPGPVDHNRNKSCIFRRPNPDVVAFVNDKKVKVDSAKFPAGTEVVYRCVDIGKYSFEGSARRRCVGGQWTGTEPLCLGLSQEYDYARKAFRFTCSLVEKCIVLN
ncbi:UNVERIFIED_CONTAM: hypothetical protein NCL1_17491 [Trichonephila clavipes]